MKKRMTRLMAMLLCGAMLTGWGAAGIMAETESSSEETEADSSSEETEAASSAASSAEEEEETTAKKDEAAASMAEEASRNPILDIPTIEGDYKIEDCVKLSDYKGLKLQMDISEVTDEEVDEYIEYLVRPVEVEDDKAVLGEGDTANLDFVGTKDGEEFSGGSSTGFDLEIGSGAFIPGFEDGMIGMKKGEERDLELTFPEDYVSEELAGQDVVFHVTLNAIKRMPELTDDWVKDYTDGEYKTVEEFHDVIREEMEAQNHSYAEAGLQTDAWTQILEESEFLAFPETRLEELREEYMGYVESEAEMYSLTVDEYIEQMGMTKEQFDQINEAQVRTELQNELMMDALVEAEGISEKDPEYQEELKRLEETYGMTEEELNENYGEDMVKRHLLSVVVINKVLSYADITENILTADE